MKNVIALSTAAAIALLSGCAAIQQGDLYRTDAVPTVQSVTAAGGEQIYKGTLYTARDFNSDGSPRTFAQYNFAKESAPCTALGDSYTGAQMGSSESFHEINKGGQSFLFNCRADNSASQDAARLYLIGSTNDCSMRNGVNGRMTTFGKSLALKCNGARRNPGQPTATDLAYNK